MDIRNIFLVKFYKSSSGNEPVREWLKNLSRIDKKNIGDDIKTLQIGWPIGMPLVKYLGNGLYEIRSSLSGKKTARIVFCVYNNMFMLLHGFIKKSQKIPVKDLELAKKRMREVKQ